MASSKRSKSRKSRRSKPNENRVLPTAGKTSNVAPKPAETPAPHPLAEADALFEDGEPGRDVTLLQAIRAMFHAPNVGKTGNPTVDFLSSVLLANADDTYLTQNLNNVLDHADVVDRVLLRAEWRAEFAVEIARRVEKGEVVR